MDYDFLKFLRKVEFWKKINKENPHKHQFIKICAICGKSRAEFGYDRRVITRY